MNFYPGTAKRHHQGSLWLAFAAALKKRALPRTRSAGTRRTDLSALVDEAERLTTMVRDVMEHVVVTSGVP